MWQSLVQEMQETGFTVLAVALDTAEAARPWIAAAKPDYPCVIDADHHVAALYGLVNVPQAVWIDEAGRIVRPPETAGSDDAFRAMDRHTGAMPEAVAAARLKRKAAYLDAVRHWARRGAGSVHAMTETQVAARLPAASDDVAQAHALFRLGQHLLRLGQEAEARSLLEQATALHPDSWAMWRQAAPKNERGLAVGDAFWARVDALGDRPYYPQSGILPPGD